MSKFIPGTKTEFDCGTWKIDAYVNDDGQENFVTVVRSGRLPGDSVKPTDEELKTLDIIKSTDQIHGTHIWKTNYTIKIGAATLDAAKQIVTDGVCRIRQMHTICKNKTIARDARAAQLSNELQLIAQLAPANVVNVVEIADIAARAERKKTIELIVAKIESTGSRYAKRFAELARGLVESV